MKKNNEIPTSDPHLSLGMPESDWLRLSAVLEVVRMPCIRNILGDEVSDFALRLRRFINGKLDIELPYEE